MDGFVKERSYAGVGSIPDLLQTSQREIRFYTDVAPGLGVRVPTCYEARRTPEGYRTVLEDLSGWAQGGDPVKVARWLRELHSRWENEAATRWSWLRRDSQAAAVAIGDLYNRVWAKVATRTDVTPSVRSLGARLLGRVEALELAEVNAPRLTLIHGDASLRNARTSPTGEITFIDWEDVRLASGAVDLTWLLVSSVDPASWSEVVAAYGLSPVELRNEMPGNAAQALLSLADYEEGSPDAAAWVHRLEAAAAFV